MNDLFPVQVLQRVQYLNCEPSNECQREPLEIIVLYELIQVNAQEFKGYAQMVSKVEGVVHLNNVVVLLWVLNVPLC